MKCHFKVIVVITFLYIVSLLLVLFGFFALILYNV